MQVEQVEWQATHSADDVERYNLGMESIEMESIVMEVDNPLDWKGRGIKMGSKLIKNGIKMARMKGDQPVFAARAESVSQLGRG